MPKAWLKSRKRDYYYQKAKKERYRSRAAYKLLQAVKKYHFIKPGDAVLDLGAAPGGWLQASRKIVGEEGFVLGVDIKPIEPLPSPNVLTAVADITEPETPKKIVELLSRKVDVVVSDVSPNISGVWEVDHARQIELAKRSLHIANSVLKPNGNLFVKVFQGDMLQDFVQEVKRRFKIVRIVKPKASKAKSSELYILGMGLKNPAEKEWPSK